MQHALLADIVLEIEIYQPFCFHLALTKENILWRVRFMEWQVASSNAKWWSGSETSNPINMGVSRLGFYMGSMVDPNLENSTRTYLDSLGLMKNSPNWWHFPQNIPTHQSPWLKLLLRSTLNSRILEKSRIKCFPFLFFSFN